MREQTETPVPPHLSDAERALWEKYDALIQGVADCSFDCGEWTHDDEDETYGDVHDRSKAAQAAMRAFVGELLTALSSERAAGEEARKMLGVLIASAGGKAVLYPRMLKLDYTVHRADGEDGIVHLWSIPAAPSTETPR